MTIKPTERVLLQLLRAAINIQDATLDKALSDPEWHLVYEQAAKQGVLAVVWESVRRLPADLQPGRGLKIQWAYGAEQIVSRAQKQVQEATRFTTLCTEAGCRLILLKGIGLSRYYPFPLQRECGDIDLFLPDGFEKGNQTARSRGMTVSDVDYKHNHIRSNGIVFENHRYLTSFKGRKSDIRRLERIFQDAIKSGDFVPFGDAGFHVLSPTVNALYITYHSFFHFLIEGITLRHLLDWALFAGTEQNAIDWNYFYRVCDDLGFSRFANTMNAIAVDVWGIPLTNPDLKFDRCCVERVLDDVLSDKRHVSGLPVCKRRPILVSNMLSSRWKYRQLYGRSFIGEMVRSVFGVLFDRSPELG